MPSLSSIKTHAAPAVWLLSVLMLFAPLGAHAAGAVLCIEADGEVALERAEGAACAEAADEHTAPGVSHCDSCTDVPLPSGGDTDCASYKMESGPSAQTVLPLAALLPAMEHVSFQPLASSSFGEDVPPPGPAPLRSVVLQL